MIDILFYYVVLMSAIIFEKFGYNKLIKVP
jgi:hypothetical protein